MGLIKDKILEHYEYDLRRYEELNEMSLENNIEEIDKEIEDAKDEIRSLLDYNDVEELDDIENFISEIKGLESSKSELEDFIAERNELREQLKKY